MTHRQQRFVDEYLHDLNATQAAIRAGYSENSAHVDGPRLLGNASVSRAIATLKAKRAAKSVITQERVLDELAALAHSDPTHYVMDDHGNLALAPHAPRNAMKAVSSVKRRRIVSKDGDVTFEVEFKLWDKPSTLKLAGRHVDLFQDLRFDDARVQKLVDDQFQKRIDEARKRLEARQAGAVDVEVTSTNADGGADPAK